MAACVYIVLGGVKNGIEKWNKIFMPLLFVVLIVLIVRGLSLDREERGLIFYLNPDFSKINLDVIIAALGQAFLASV